MTVELAPARIRGKEKILGQNREFKTRRVRGKFMLVCSVEKIADFADNLSAQIKEKSPNITLYGLMKKTVGQSPLKIPLQVQEKAMQAIASADANTKALGKKAFLFLKMQTLLSAVDAFYIEEIDSPEDRDEMLTSAIVYLMEKIDVGMTINSQFSGKINGIAKDGIAKYLTEKYDMPIGIIRNSQDRLSVLTRIGEEIENGFPTRDSIEKLAGELCEQAGFVDEDKKKETVNWLMFLNAQKKEEGKKSLLEQEEDVYFADDSRRELRGQIEESLSTLKRRERKVIELRFGLEDGSEELTPKQEGPTLEQVGKKFGVTRERIRQIEVKAIRRLRHPSRSAKLRPYRGGGDTGENNPPKTKKKEDPGVKIDLSIRAFKLNDTQTEMLMASGIREIGDFFSTSAEELVQEWLGTPSGLANIMKINLMPILDNISKKLKAKENLSEQEIVLFYHATNAILYRMNRKSAIGINLEERTRMYEKARNEIKAFIKQMLPWA